MTCPACGAPIVEQTPILDLLICDTCLRSVVASDGRLATEAETLLLSREELAALKSRRKSFRAVRVPV